MKQRLMSRRGFTLMELVVSVGIFMVAITVALMATIGTNSLIARTDSRSAVTESARSVSDVMRRATINAPVGAVTLHGYYTNPDSYAGIRIKQFSTAQARNTCDVIGRATKSLSASNEETYTLSTTGDVIAYWVYPVDSALQCPDLTTAPLYQNRLTSSNVKVSSFEAQMNSYDCQPSANCTTKQQLRYRFALEVATAQTGKSRESRNPSTVIASSLPIGLINVGTVPVNIITTDMPNGTAGQAYLKEILAEGGRQPYTWSHTGNLASFPGLSLAQQGNNYVLQGTTSSTGTVSLAVTVRDSSGTVQVDTQNLSFEITSNGPPVGGGLIITTNSLPSGTVNTPYSQTLQARDGYEPYAWSVTSGNLPTGLSLNGSSGTISGTPSLAGVYNFTVQVTDSNSQTASKNLSITINSSGSTGGGTQNPEEELPQGNGSQ